MQNAFDVASYLIKLSLDVGEPLTNMKLQKLLYYSYAWYLVEKENTEKLFDERILAWQYGPVVEAVYSKYKFYGADIIKESLPDCGDSSNLVGEVKELVRETFMAYADKTAIQLMNLTHTEVPWLKTYDATKSNKVIPDELIYSFYLEKKQQFNIQSQ